MYAVRKRNQLFIIQSTHSVYLIWRIFGFVIDSNNNVVKPVLYDIVNCIYFALIASFSVIGHKERKMEYP